MARPEPDRGDQLPQQSEQRDQGECGRVSAAPVLHGRSEQAADAHAGRHSAAGQAAGARRTGGERAGQSAVSVPSELIG